MTYVTGFFLVFAGMLIGYFLWYRDRSSDEASRLAMTRENEDLRTSLKLAHNSHEKLDERFTRQKGQLNVLQQLCDDWSSSREQAERDRAQLEMEVTDKNRRYEEAVADLQTEKQSRINLEDEAHKLTQQQIEKLSDLESEWRERHTKIEASLFERQADLKSTSGENDRITTQLENSHEKIAELQEELAKHKSLLETTAQHASGFQQEFVSAETSLKENSELLLKTQFEYASAVSAQKAAEDSLVSLQEEFRQSRSHVEKLRARVAILDPLESQVDSLQQARDNTEEQLQKVLAQRDEALEAQKSLLAQAYGLQKRVDNQESTIHKLRAKLDGALENLKLELTQRAEIETRFEQTSADWETRWKDQMMVLDQRTGDRDKLVSELNKHRDGIATASAELNRRAAEHQQLESKLGKHQEELTKANSELEHSRKRGRELTGKVEELKTTCLRISELEKLVQQRDLEDKQVIAELRSLREHNADAEQKQHELQSELDRMSAQWQEVESTSTQSQHQLESLRMKLKASEETIRTLRRERAAVLARLANYRTIAEPDATVISFTEAMARRQRTATEYDQEYGGHTSQHAVRGRVYTEAPESRDDLKRISGIAEVLEARLNDYGIYTFKQIMEWQPEAIEEFSRLLAFKDRIERDEWLDQASYFYNEKQKQRSVAA